jgi:hypothetical protein
LICKHFNLSLAELWEKFDLPRYYVLLAEALDAEELEDYDRHRNIVNIALAHHAPKKLPKWKWSSIDQAGTKAFDSVTGKMTMTDAFAGLLGKAGGQVSKGSVDEYQRATGKPVAYRAPDGRIVDIEGNPVHRTPEHIILRLPQAEETSH